jgi:prepilin-type N-terminal cleavage/methylation domain-containing protein
MTLVEMLVALVIFSIVLAAALGALRNQTRGFDRGAEEMAVLQNMRFAADVLQQEVRSSGNNLAPEQPPIVYAGVNAFAFNADLNSNTPGDLDAVFVDPDAPNAEVNGFLLADQATIPQSSPAYAYPLADYIGNTAETIMFYFEPDASTADPNDFRLMRQVNAQPAELLVRNILAFPGRPFFQYYHETSGRIDSVPSAWYPMTHPSAIYTGSQAVQINQMRAVEVNFSVSNGRTGAAQTTQPMSVTVSLPNMGIDPPPNCGAAPILSVGLTGTSTGWENRERVDLSWPAAFDEAGGARDVVRYVIWRRQGAAPWGPPYSSVAAGHSTYVFTDDNVVVGQTYEYRLAAQDCTPGTSALAGAFVTVVTGPPQP